MDQSAKNASAVPALSGVKVIELSQFDAGAACSQALAWLGADVVKIEGSIAKRDGHSLGSIESYNFLLLNANKRSVECDAASDKGNKDLRDLLTRADVFVEHLAPGAIERWGLGYNAVRQLNPRIIYVQIKGFASDTPYAGYLSNDAIAQAVGGALSATGYIGGPPLVSGPTVADTGAALQGAMAVLAALYQRRSTGRGQRIEIVMQGSVISIHRNSYHGQLTRGKIAERIGNTNKNGAVPSDLYACKPGGPNDCVFISISNSANQHWRGLLKAMGREELLNDPKYATPRDRRNCREEIDAMVADWCRQRTKVEAMDAIQRAGAPAGAVLDMKDLSNDPFLRKRGTFVTLEHPQLGQITLPGWPVKMSDSNVPVQCAPQFGAHTQQVMLDWSRITATSDSPPPMASNTPSLAGVRIVDLTQFESGTSCTEALAWFGADVVKVEQPEKGDRGRYGNTEKPGVDSYYFILLNANKRSLTCDLKSESGKELLKNLIRNADVIIENMAPGAIERLGFGYEAVRQLNPRIIFAQIKGFPSTGPYADYLCFDMIAQAAGGSISLTGAEGALPLRAGPNLGDTGAGMHCVVGILAALYQRHTTGRGQRIEVAMQEAVINFSRMGFADYLASGKPPGRRHVRGMLYACKGGGPNDYCCVQTSGISDEQVNDLLRTIGASQMIEPQPVARRQDQITEIEPLLSKWCLGHTKTEVMDTMQSIGIAAGAVFDTRELIDDPDLFRSGLFASISHPVRGPVTIPAWPIKMSETHVPVRSAPLLGAHTDEVVSEWLGSGVGGKSRVQDPQSTVS